jgi:hypothetical protein
MRGDREVTIKGGPTMVWRGGLKITGIKMGEKLHVFKKLKMVMMCVRDQLMDRTP